MNKDTYKLVNKMNNLLLSSLCNNVTYKIHPKLDVIPNRTAENGEYLYFIFNNKINDIFYIIGNILREKR